MPLTGSYTIFSLESDPRSSQLIYLMPFRGIPPGALTAALVYDSGAKSALHLIKLTRTPSHHELLAMKSTMLSVVIMMTPRISIMGQQETNLNRSLGNSSLPVRGYQRGGSISHVSGSYLHFQILTAAC